MMVTIDRVRDALVVVDVQPDFMPGGALPIVGGDEVVAPITDLLLGGTFHSIVATQDWHPKGHVSFASSHEGEKPFATIELYEYEQVLWPDHCVQGSPGAALHSALRQEPVSAIIRKGQHPLIDSYSGFRDNHGPTAERRETGLAGYLRSRGVERVVICGLAFDVCVAWTALDAVTMGFRAVVLRDLARSVTVEGERGALAELEAAGVIVATRSDLGVQ